MCYAVTVRTRDSVSEGAISADIDFSTTTVEIIKDTIEPIQRIDGIDWNER